ncbi:hypothetical protein T06_11526 [Trichinella sp. T6]|nr:hypothetical protein T06_11526 [Trichinella sp. T6]
MDTPIDPKMSIWICLTTYGLERRADTVAPPLLLLQTRKPTCGFTGATSALLGQFLETEVRSTTLSCPLSIAKQTHHVAGSTNCDVSEKLFRIKIFNDSPWIRSMSGRLHCPTSSSSTITAHLMPFGLFSPSEPRSMLPSIPSGADSISNLSGCCQATEPLVRHHHEDPLNVELIQLNHFFTPELSLRTQFGRQQIMSFQS